MIRPIICVSHLKLMILFEFSKDISKFCGTKKSFLTSVCLFSKLGPDSISLIQTDAAH